MNDQRHKDTLKTVVGRVLEQAAFVFADEGGEPSQIDPSAMQLIQISLTFTGTRSGRVMLILPIELCREFAVNMLGADPTECESRDSQVDAGKEIANMVTGQLLTDLYGTQEVFDLTAPQATDLTPEAFFSTLDSNEYVCTMVDERPVIAIFSEMETTHEHQSISR